MAGANYMGGKRNAVRARAKDTTGCTQKRFFGQQRLNLASRKLEAEEGGGVGMRMPKSTIPAISFAHAKNLGNLPGLIPEPIHVAPCTPTSKTRLSKLNEDKVVSSARSSRILEALDTNEPVSLRAAMDRILALPDLAGLSNQTVPRLRPCLHSKRQRPSPPSSPCEKRQKRQKFSSPLPPSSAPRTASSPISTNFLSEGSGDWGKNWDGAFKQNMKNEECEDATNFLSPPQLQIQEPRIRPSHRNIRYPLTPSSNLSHTSVVPGSVSQGRQQPDESQLGFPFSGNIFDYEDPWKAVGLILGIEEAPHTPLKTRNFHAILAELPSDPAFGSGEFYRGSGSCDSPFSGGNSDSAVTSGSRTTSNLRSSGTCDTTPEFSYQPRQAVYLDIDAGNGDDALDEEMEDYTVHDADDSYKFSPLSTHSAHSDITLPVQLRPVTPENQVIRQSFHLRSPSEPMPSSSFSIFDTQISKPSLPLRELHPSFNQHPCSSQSNASMLFSTSSPATNSTPPTALSNFAARSSKRVAFRKTFGGSEENSPEMSFSSPPSSYTRGSRIGFTFGASDSPAPAITTHIPGPPTLADVLDTQSNTVPIAENDHTVVKRVDEDMLPACVNGDKDLKMIRPSHSPRETLLNSTAHPKMDIGHDILLRHYDEESGDHTFSTREAPLTPTSDATRSADVQCSSQEEVVGATYRGPDLFADDELDSD